MKSAISITVLLIFLLFSVVGCKKGGEAGKAPENKEPVVIRFLVPEEGVSIERNYNQLVQIPIRNEGKATVRLRIESNHFPDFPAGFVGRGTPDWEVPDTVLEIPPGEVWDAPLLLHGNGPGREEYVLTLKARQDGKEVASADLKVLIAKPKLEIAIEWAEPEKEVDRAKLTRILKLKNNGATAADFNIRFEPKGVAPGKPITFSPVVEKAWFQKWDTMEIMVSPYLYPSFESLEGDIVISGLGQEIRTPYKMTVPEGKKVFVTLSRTTSKSTNNGTRCTNSPGATYNMPPTSGTPAHSGWSPSGGGLTVRDTPPRRADPVDGEESEEDEEDEEGTLSLFGPISEEEAGSEELAEEGSEEDGEIADETDNPDSGTFDLQDANAEGLVGGLVVSSSGTTGDETEAGSDDEPAEDVVPALPLTVAPEEPRVEIAKRAITLAEPDGKRTHMTRRKDDEGNDFLNFGWGIQGKGRRLGGHSVPGIVGNPGLGPNPKVDGPALANYVARNDAGTTEVRSLNPETGKSVVLSDPSKSADSPVSLRAGGGVKTLFREDGAIRSVALGEDMAPADTEGWPNGVEAGPLLAAAETPGGLALLTREPGGKIAFRDAENTKNFDAVSGAMLGSMVALRDAAGSISVVDPRSGETTYKVEGSGYGEPSLAKTHDGGARLYYDKALPASGEGGGNFAVDMKGGQWGEPRRVFMPEAPVTDAAVAVEFTPAYAMANYKKMDTEIAFNGRKLREMKGEVPFGRYVFQIPDSALKYSSAASTGNEGNRVVIDSNGIGRGNFLITDKCSVYGRHEMTQGCYVAGSNAEADRIARESNGEFRHDMHDIVLATNGSQLPRDLQPGQKRDFRISAFNTGDTVSPESTVEVRHEGVKVGEGKLPPLRPFEGAALELGFTVPTTWSPGESLLLTAHAPEDGDADAATNSMDLSMLKELLEEVSGPTGPASVDVGKLPPGSITDVPAAGAANPFSAPLETGKLWFRSAIPAEGELKLEVKGSGANGVDRIDLFDAEGRAVSQEGSQWKPGGDSLLIRIGYPPDEAIPPDTRVDIWWE